jgi:hypothetical protein
MSQEQITDCFNVFDPHEALPPNDPRYVECSKERGSVGLFESMARKIRFSKGRTCQLLSGHRGCGKTTELLRLQQTLLTQEPRHFVVYCEANQYIDLNDVEYTDVLLAVVQQLWQAAKDNGVSLEPGHLKDFLYDLKGFLTTPVEPKDLDFGVGIAKLSFEIKKNPNNRQLVRAHLRPRATGLLEAVNEIIQAANEAFKVKGYKGIVIIIDNLDRIFRNPVPTTTSNSHDALFVDASGYLRGLSCDLIYTVPPALLYSSSGLKLPGLYGSLPQMLPMIPVTTRNREANEEGVAKLIEAIERRLNYVSVHLDIAFDSEQTIRRVCAASGGYVRGLMTLIQTATSYVEELPITERAVEQTILDIRNGFLMGIRTPQRWQLLRTISENKPVTETEDYLQLLENFTVLEYRDAIGPWYDVNPVIREAPELAS